MIAKPYARALFELAIESFDSNKFNDITSDIHSLSHVLNSQNDLQKFLSLPILDFNTKLDMLHIIFENELSDETMGLLKLILIKRRAYILTDILEEYNKLLKEHNNITDVNLVSSMPLSIKYISSVKRLLSQKLHREINIITKIDTTLIGGIYINIEGKVLDLSIKKQLHDMKSKLYKI